MVGLVAITNHSLLIAGLGIGFTWVQNQTSLQIAKDNRAQDLQIAADQQRAAILQTYIDNIQDLLLNHNLLKSKSTDGVAILARARTLTALQGLDPGHLDITCWLFRTFDEKHCLIAYYQKFNVSFIAMGEALGYTGSVQDMHETESKEPPQWPIQPSCPIRPASICFSWKQRER